eukprot:TRINITY_DN1453_c0_g1_i7.p1 TRINITY_DN1453_c0_g1~~TRINITY_DN1453_c0_g1_i7.p1  ORF type:complete len:197 (+),score=24.04 TRINITY_DN1453_c0_g1_i7:124-714(+)
MENHGNTDMLERLVALRIENFKFIKQIHREAGYWMNTIKISKDDIRRWYSEQEGINLTLRSCQWFYMGISIGILLKESADVYITAFAGFWDEYNNWTKRGGKERKKSTDKFLRTPHIPSASFSYFEMLFSLCDVLEQAYKKLAMTPTKLTASVLAEITRADTFCQEYVIKPVTKDLNVVAASLLKKNMRTLYPSLS